jgi:AcrR family transcriptional regulator
MQVLKTEIWESIIKESLSLFYVNGFEKTSTRDIASKVNISVSNLYKYFENKEAIFDSIVKDYYINYRNMLSNFLAHENEDTFDEEEIILVSNSIFESIKGQYQKFVILMNKSNGTKYSGFKNEVIKKIEQHIREGSQEIVKDEYIITVYARNFFYGIVEIADNYVDDKWAYHNIYLLVKYHMTGISTLYK